jgi:PAS domain S-box-containing protein
MTLPALNRQALVAAAIYLVFGLLWIALSDRLLASLVSDPVRLTLYQSYKGAAFVAVMAALAYGLTSRLSRQVEALRESEMRLAESELRFREMADHIDQVFYLAAPDYRRFFYVSPAYEKIWGRSVASLMDDPASWIEGLHADDRDRILATIAAGRDTGFYEAEYRILRPDGVLRWVHARAFELQDESGHAYRVAGIVEDITDRRKAAEEIRGLTQTLEARVRERTAELEQANRELEAFSYSVSHDLRSPLRALDGFAHLLTEDTGSQIGPDGLRMLGRIRVNAEKMGNLIDDILEFSRIGRGEIRREPVAQMPMVQAVAAELGADFPAARITIAPLPTTIGDPVMLRQVWVNLIGNALKFSSKHPEPRIDIVSEPAGDGVMQFIIRDNGAGFDMAYADRLFGVFQRLHRADDFPGTGAGLAIVKRIVERHGGKIWAEATPGQGATFRFTLPSPSEPAN